MSISNHDRVHVGNKTYNLKQDSAISIDAEEYFIEQQPDAAMQANVFQANSYVDFTIGNTLDKVNKLVLKLQLTNSNTVPITVVPGHLLLDHYQLFIGKVEVDTVYGWNSFIDNATLNTDDVTSQYVGSLAGYDGIAFVSTNTIPVGGSIMQYIPLSTPLDTIRPTISAWPQLATIRLRIFFATGTNIYIGAATTGLAINGVTLRVHGQVINPFDISKETNSLVRNGELAYRFLQHRAGTTQIGSWTANTANRIQMNNVNGDIAFIHFTLRAPNPQGTAMITPLPLVSFQMETSSQNNILGINQVEDSYVRSMLSPEKMPRTFFYQKTATYLTSWCPNCRLVYKQGARVGGNDTFAGKHFLTVVPQTTQGYLVDVMAMAYTFLRVKSNGIVEVDTMFNIGA